MQYMLIISDILTISASSLRILEQTAEGGLSGRCFFFFAVKPVLPRPALFFSGLGLCSLFQLFVGFFCGNSWWFLVFTGQQGTFFRQPTSLNETASLFLLLFNPIFFLSFFSIVQFFFCFFLKKMLIFLLLYHKLFFHLEMETIVLYKQHFLKQKYWFN